MGRTESIEKGARKRDLLEEGESIAVAVPVNGAKQMGLGLEAYSTKHHSFDGQSTQRFALAASDTNFYVFELGHFGFKSVKSTLLKMPVGEVDFDKSFSELKVYRRDNPDDGASFALALAVSPKQLIEHVEARR